MKTYFLKLNIERVGTYQTKYLYELTNCKIWRKKNSKTTDIQTKNWMIRTWTAFLRGCKEFQNAKCKDGAKCETSDIAEGGAITRETSS